jgi:hypothetical protein
MGVILPEQVCNLLRNVLAPLWKRFPWGCKQGHRCQKNPESAERKACPEGIGFLAEHQSG